MTGKSLGTAMNRLALIACVVVLAPIARGPFADSVAVTGQTTGKHGGFAPVVLAQGRCFNGKCF